MFGSGHRLDGAGRCTLALAVLVVGAFCAEAYGQQLRINSQVSKGYAGVGEPGRVGNTFIRQHFGDTTPGASAWSQPAGTLSAPTPLVTGFGRRPGRLDLVSRNPAVARAVQLPTTWRRTLSPSGAARYFTAAPDFGQYFGGQPTPRALNAQLLLDPQRLLSTTAFAAPAYYAGISTGGIRDPLSRQEQIAAEEFSGTAPVGTERHSQAELMGSRLVALRKQGLNEAWDWFQKGEYARAHASFRTAEILDRQDPEPRVGIFFCHLSEQAFMQVLASTARIMAWDANTPVFDADYRLPERYAPPEEQDAGKRRELGEQRLETSLEGLKAFYLEHQGELGVQVAAAYALWHGGHKSEAALLARSVAQGDAQGPYGRFATKLIKAYEKQTAEIGN